MTSKTIENTCPILGVRDLDASIRFYTEELEFGVDWRTDVVCSISRDECSIMLSSHDPRNRHSWVWIGTHDDSLFDLFRERSPRVFEEAKNRPWAYEIKIEDPDGNVLWLGTEPRSEPFDE